MTSAYIPLTSYMVIPTYKGGWEVLFFKARTIGTLNQIEIMLLRIKRKVDIE